MGLGAVLDHPQFMLALDPHHPWIRLALTQPHGRPARRQSLRTKQHAHQGLDGPRRPDHQGQEHVRAAEQIAEIGRRHPELGRLRLVVTRESEADAMTLRAECTSASEALRGEVAATLRTIAKLGGGVELVGTGSLPNDSSSKAISDER
jgi:phenylacetate-CoA ligase